MLALQERDEVPCRVKGPTVPVLHLLPQPPLYPDLPACSIRSWAYALSNRPAYRPRKCSTARSRSGLRANTRSSGTARVTESSSWEAQFDGGGGSGDEPALRQKNRVQNTIGRAGQFGLLQEAQFHGMSGSVDGLLSAYEASPAVRIIGCLGESPALDSRPLGARIRLVCRPVQLHA